MNNDKDIAKRLRERDETAFDIIYYRYKDTIYCYIYDIVKNRETTEELTNDTFLTMYNSIDTYNEKYKFKNWLIQIAKNKAINHLNREKTYVLIEEEEIASKKSEPGKIERLLKSILGETEYQIMLYRIVYGYKFKEIASELKMKTSNVFRIYKQAIAKMKKELGGDFYE